MEQNNKLTQVNNNGNSQQSTTIEQVQHHLHKQYPSSPQQVTGNTVK